MSNDTATNRDPSTTAIPLLTTDLPNVTQPNTNEFSDFTPLGQADENPMTDAANEIWQERRHKTPATKNSRGLWVMRRGRPLCEPKYATQPTVDQGVNVSGLSESELDATAEIYAEAWANLHTLPYGEHGYDAKLISPVKTSIKNYMKVKELPAMPPSIPVLITALGYTSKTARKPQNIDKTNKILGIIFGNSYKKFKAWLFKNKPQEKDVTAS